MSKTTATILFVDLSASSEFANIYELEKYDEYIDEFQGMIKGIFKEETKKISKDYKEYYVRGDEGCLILYRTLKGNNKNEMKEDDVLLSIKIALCIKMQWLFKQRNIDRIKDGKKPSDLGIGINTGDVIIKKHISAENSVPYNAEGYAINLAKRVETASKNGAFSGIFLSENTYNIYEQTSGEDTLHFEPAQTTYLKGLSQEVKLYELTCATLADYDRILDIPKEIENDPKIGYKINILRKTFNGTHNTLIGLCLCNYYWAKEKYEDAEYIARKLIALFPAFAQWKLLLAQVMFDMVKNQKFNKNACETLYNQITELLEGVIKNMPHQVDAYLDLGSVHVYRGKEALKNEDKRKHNNEALQLFEKGLRWDQQYGSLYYNRAKARLLPIDPGKESIYAAIRDLKKAFKINPGIKRTFKRERTRFFKILRGNEKIKDLLR